MVRVAIAAEDDRGLEGIAAHHFGRCPYYVFVDVAGEQIQKVEVLPNPSYENHQPGVVPAFIHQQGAEMMISGGMGQRAIALFHRYGIQAYTGAAGTVRRVLESALGGALQDAAPCQGHDEHEHAGEEHDDLHRLKEELEAMRDLLDSTAQKLG